MATEQELARQERRAELQESAPLKFREDGAKLALTRTKYELLVNYATATAHALVYAKSASRTYEWLRPLVGRANGAALAQAALTASIEELRSLEEQYGIELLPQSLKREPNL